MDLVRTRALQRGQIVAQRGREGNVNRFERSQRLRPEVGEHRIDAVDAGAGHQSDVKLGCHSAWPAIDHSAPARTKSRPKVSSAASGLTCAAYAARSLGVIGCAFGSAIVSGLRCTLSTRNL